jgi:threonylcarbamoyladenosine tRNA methylthiotransferase MtaB
MAERAGIPERGTYRVTTLGCRVNRADSIAIERRLSKAGMEKADAGATPEVWVLNTCAVTAEGMRKSRKAARRCAGSGSFVVITGCAAEMDPAVFLEMPGVHAVLPNSAKENIERSIPVTRRAGGEAGGWSFDGQVRVPVKVQDGCSRYCTYCIVPYLRGSEYSRPVESVVAEIIELEAGGAGEAVLCGIDLGGYSDPSTGAGLTALAEKALSASENIWIRLSSLELSDVSDGLLELVRTHPRLCGHLHLPLQSGDRGVLAGMGRHYEPSAFRARVEGIRAAVPGVSITTDVMVGFPGETEDAFANTRRQLADIGFPRVHVFKYSPRPGTAAFALGDPVDSRVKERRATELRELAGRMAARFHAGFTGRIMPVLIEATMKSDADRVFGRAQNFAGVVLPGGADLIGRYVDALITGAGEDFLTGEVASMNIP